MKKTTAILASAIALVMAGSAIAETTVYGRARMALQIKDGAKGLINDSSRFGFKGSEDLGNGMSAIYKFELGYNADNAAQASGVSTRIGMVGLKGDFGTFAMGNMWSPTYNLVNGNLDAFNHFGIAQLPTARVGDVLAYANKFGDVTLQAALVSTDGTDDLNDGYDIAVSFPAGPVKIGLGITDNTNDSGMSLSAVYAGDGFSVGLDYQDLEDLGKDKLTALLGTMNVGAKGKLLLRWESLDNADITGTTVGYFHNLSKRTQAYIENSSADLGDATVIGLKHNF